MKFLSISRLTLMAMSLPLWECGLKFVYELQGIRITQSLPLWECGLKYRQRLMILRTVLVTPLVGVWIEIFTMTGKNKHDESLPLWECGLK